MLRLRQFACQTATRSNPAYSRFCEVWGFLAISVLEKTSRYWTK